MVLVKQEVPVGTIDGNGGLSTPRPSAGAAVPTGTPHPSQGVLPQTAYETEFRVQVPCVNQVPHAIQNRAGREDYQMQLMLLEQQNLKRLRAATNVNSANGTPEACEESALQDFATQKRLFEQQNGKPLMPPRQPGQDVVQASGASREDYHMEQMALEQENQRRLSGARQGQAHPSSSLQAEHQAQALFDEEMSRKRKLFPTEGRNIRKTSAQEHQDYQAQLMLLGEQNRKSVMQAQKVEKFRDRRLDADPAYYQQQLMALEQQNKRRLLAAREEDEAKRRRGTSMPTSEQTQQFAEQNYFTGTNQLAEQSITLREQAAAEGRYPVYEDKWGQGPFPAGQGVIAGYQIQLMALENRRKEEAAMRSQTEVEFAEQRQRYQSEVSEMSSFSTQRLPGTPGTSCTPTGTPMDTPRSTGDVVGQAALEGPLPFRPAPGQSADIDDLYD